MTNKKVRRMVGQKMNETKAKTGVKNETERMSEAAKQRDKIAATRFVLH